MKSLYILVDFENIQPSPDSLSYLGDKRIKLLIFVGANQKLSVDLVKMLQPLGDKVKYVDMSGVGKNALDFFITFYLGRLSCENVDSDFIIVSKDTGYDPLIKHLSQKKSISVARVENIALIFTQLSTDSIEPTKIILPPSKTPGIVRERVTRICDELQKTPDKMESFTVEMLRDIIKKKYEIEEISENHINGIVNFMTVKELIVIDPDGKIQFNINNIKHAVAGRFISKAPSVIDKEEWLKLVCIDLQKRGNSKPQLITTLHSTIKKAILKIPVTDAQIEEFLEFMKQRKIITVSNENKVSYDLV